MSQYSDEFPPCGCRECLPKWVKIHPNSRVARLVPDGKIDTRAYWKMIAELGGLRAEAPPQVGGR